MAELLSDTGLIQLEDFGVDVNLSVFITARTIRAFGQAADHAIVGNDLATRHTASQILQPSLPASRGSSI